MGGSNMAIDVGTAKIRAPYFVGERTGVLTGLASPNPVFAMRYLGMAVNDGAGGTRLVNAPLPVSQVRLKYGPTTDGTAGVAFEVFKATAFTAQLTGGRAGVVQKRKTSDYPSISAAEVDVRVSDTGTLAAGTFTVPDLSPFDMAMSRGAVLAGCQSVWKPDDLMPLVLEQNEGLIVRVAAFTGTGILYVGVDFGR